MPCLGQDARVMGRRYQPWGLPWQRNEGIEIGFPSANSLWIQGLLICIAMKPNPSKRLPHIPTGRRPRIADADSRRAAGSVLAAQLTLCLLWSVPSLPAQAPPATPFPRPAAHQAAQPRRAAPGKESANTVAPAASAIQFENVIERSKIKFKLKNSISPQRYTFETMTGGVAVFDYDNDGLLDIFFTNGAAIPSLEKSDPSYSNRLFRNNGDGTFTDVTEKAGLQGIGYSMGVAAGDYDNDGFVDLYVTGVNRNQLFHNNGDGTFTDVTEKAGVGGIVPKLGKAWSVAAGWFDYNNDGLLDLFVVNYLNYNIKTATHCVQQGLPAYCSPVDFLGTPNILYRNNGDGTFTDVSEQSHISQYVGKGMGLAFADYDNDGFTDIFVSNDTFENYLLHNNGDGTFTNVAMLAGVAYNAYGNAIAGMGADFRDIDNDGKPDIFETAMFGEGFPLYKNLGDGQFQDVSGDGRTECTDQPLNGLGSGDFRFRQRREQGPVHRQLRHSGQFHGAGAPALCASQSGVSQQGQSDVRGSEFKGRNIVLSSGSASRRGLRRPQQRRQDRCRRDGSERPAGDMDEPFQRTITTGSF